MDRSNTFNDAVREMLSNGHMAFDTVAKLAQEGLSAEGVEREVYRRRLAHRSA